MLEYEGFEPRVDGDDDGIISGLFVERAVESKCMTDSLGFHGQVLTCLEIRYFTTPLLRDVKIKGRQAPEVTQ